MQAEGQAYEGAGTELLFRTFLQKVFAWMVLGLAITGVIGFALSDSISAKLRAGETPGWWFWGAIIAQIAVVLILSFAINKISAAAATVLFLGYSALTGLTFAFLFAVYSASDVIAAFFATSGMFAVLAAIGYFTKKDLTSWGPILFAGLIGVLIGGLIGAFFSMAIYNIVFIWIGLLVFMGLTIYDVNRLKRQNLAGADKGLVQKNAIIGALMLYLDFINIFIRILSILGNR
ncbi:MAG: Bax inhibitor-1/YccA family protein [Actinomycetota bacterium]